MAGGWFLLIHMLLLASSDPVVRYFRYTPTNWPPSAAPHRMVFLSDIHVSGPDMPPERLLRIVEQINRLHPDIVLLGGDFLSARKLATRRYDPDTALRPLASLRATSGVIAVMGNHDHWSDAPTVRRALARSGVTILDNDAVRLGSIGIGGIDDHFTGHADIDAVERRLEALGGVPIILSHSPDIFPEVRLRPVLILAGHTHCGQINLPLIGPVFTASHYAKRFACGIITTGPRTMIVSAGIGTSLLPIRLGTRPDVWVVDIRTGNSQSLAN